jgi:glucokinase
MALGELWCGQGRGLRNLVCLTVRRGIGSGIIVDGKLLRGAHNYAGEVGLWACPEEALSSSARSSEDRPRAIQDVASVPAVLARAGVPGSPEPKILDVLQAADFGDSPAREAVEHAASHHGWILHQLAFLFDPERLIVCGPMAQSRVYQESVKRAATWLAGEEMGRRVLASELGPFSGALGASALAFHHWRPRR